MPHLVQLIGDQIQDVFPIGLSGVAAIAVMPAEFFEVVVQVTHGFLVEGRDEGARAMTFAPARRCRTAARRGRAGARTVLSFRRMLRFLRMRHFLSSERCPRRQGAVLCSCGDSSQVSVTARLERRSDPSG